MDEAWTPIRQCTLMTNQAIAQALLKELYDGAEAEHASILGDKGTAKHISIDGKIVQWWIKDKESEIRPQWKLSRF